MKHFLKNFNNTKKTDTLHFTSLLSRFIQSLFLSGLQYLYTISTAELPQEWTTAVAILKTAQSEITCNYRKLIYTSGSKESKQIQQKLKRSPK